MHGASFFSTVVQIIGLPQWLSLGFDHRPAAVPVLAQDAWAHFNSSLGGRLHLSTATSGPCSVKAELLKNFSFDTSGAEMASQDQPERAAFVEAHDTADIVKTFRFVNQTGVPLILNNLDTEFCSFPFPNSLTVLTESMTNVDYIRSFKPRQCSTIPSNPSISFSPGASLKKIYSLAEQKGVTVVGPSIRAGSTESAASFLQDTTSVLAPAFGSAIDNVLEFEVVTPEGEVRIVNSCLEPDLWHALRGGGVNNFGLVTRVTVKAHPRTPLTVFSASIKPSQSNVQRMLSAMSQNALDLAKAGWGGYASASGILLVNPRFGGNVEKAVDSLFPLKTLLQNMDVDGQVVEEKWTSFESYGSWLESDEYKVVESFILPPSTDHPISSRLITDSLFDDAYGKEDLVKAIVTPIQQVDSWLISFNLPYGYQPREGKIGTSFTPAFYRSPWMVYFVSSLQPGMKKEDRLIKYSAVAKANNFLRYLTPGSGVYSEQADLSEPNHEDAFWGADNYKSLLAAKRK
ncbi:hypothetical protein FRC05_007279 [Tulasnella sp. 425]|nr:hypothetical protein FRC05_007279 [Tulasnella sp. 425]